MTSFPNNVAGFEECGIRQNDELFRIMQLTYQLTCNMQLCRTSIQFPVS